jgi:hypothetical protein
MYVNNDGTFRLRDLDTGVSTAGANPAEMKPGTCTVRDIAPGAAFMTAEGTLVLKSEYRLRPEDPNSPAMCIILGSGEFFHGEGPGVHGDDVQVWPIYIPIASDIWRNHHIGNLRHALQEIATKSFAWDDGAAGNWELERQRWHKLRNIALVGLQTIEV